MYDEKQIRNLDVIGLRSRFGTSNEMFRKGQKRKIAETRGLFCHWCRQELGLSVTALARMLSLTPAAVFYAARRGERFAADNGFVIEPFQCGAKPPYTGHTPDRSARLPAKCPTITA